MVNKFTVSGEDLSDINPNIFGNFMEFIENHISGMWAEMIMNRKFEDILNRNGLPEFWKPDGLRNNSEYTISDRPHACTACVSIKCVEEKNGDSAISQSPVSMQKGQKYNGGIWLRAEGLTKPVRIVIGRNYGRFVIPHCEKIIDGVTGDWKKFDFELIPEVTDPNATFSVRFEGTGQLWIDAVSLMPADNCKGWRSDVVDLIKKLKPNILRFPGGCYADTYTWKQATGDRDSRMPQDNKIWSNTPWDYMTSHIRFDNPPHLVEPNDVGIDEYMDLCEMTNSEPFICVNYASGTPEEAADWVEYCNGSEFAKYGAMRAKNGHAKPYNIKIWQIGNEQDITDKIENYIKKYPFFHEAMKKADPSIEFMADGSVNANSWNEILLREIGDKMTYLDLHYYPGFDGSSACPDDVFEQMFSTLGWVRESLSHVRKQINDAGLENKVKIAVCEWNASGGNWGPDRSYFATHGVALFGAYLLDLFMKNSDIVVMSNISNLTNAWWSSVIRTNHITAHTTACYHLLAMHANNCGDKLISSSLESCLPECGGAQLIEACATKGDGFVALTLINRSAEPQSIELDLKALINKNIKGNHVILSAKSLIMMNDFIGPDRVSPVEKEIDISPSCVTELPAYSFSVLKFKT